MQDEQIDLVDSQNRVLRQASKHQAHRHGWLHRTVIGEVRDRAGNIVLVRQAPDRQDAGQFVVPIGGHVRAGESEEAALRREAFEETGLTLLQPLFVDRFIYKRRVIGRHENHYFIVYQIVADPSDIVLGPEAVEHHTFSVADLRIALQATPELFGPSYFAVVEKCFPKLLQ